MLKTEPNPMKPVLKTCHRFFSAALLILLFAIMAEAQKSCTVPYYNNLTERKQDLLAVIGISPEQWNSSSNDQRLAVFNLTAAISASGLELYGISVDWDPDKGVHKDRIYFRNTNDFYNEMKGNVPGVFSPDIGKGQEHVPYTDSYRRNVIHRSLQVSFTEQTKFEDASNALAISAQRLQPILMTEPPKRHEAHDYLDSDLDIFNPNLRGGFGLGSILHVLEVKLAHEFARLWGWDGRTSPYSVAFREGNWECLEGR